MENGTYRYNTDYMQLIRDHPVSKRLKADETAILLSKLKIEKFASGERIVRQGTESDKLYFILRGQVIILTTGRTGRQHLMTILWKNDLFGELALLSGGKRLATAEAMQETRVLTLHRDDFEWLKQHHPAVALQFVLGVLEVVSERMRSSNEYAGILSTEPALRVQLFLIDLAHHRGENRDGQVHINLVISHDKIANMLGMARETVGRKLKELRSQGIISREERLITITDLPRLEEMVKKAVHSSGLPLYRSVGQ